MLERRIGETFGFDTEILGALLEEVLRQNRNVFTPFAQAGAAMGMQSPAAFLSGTAAAAPALAGLGTAGAGLSLGGMESLLAFAPLLI